LLFLQIKQMNRCKITQDLLTKVRNFKKTGMGDEQTRRWVKRWNPVVYKQIVLHDKKMLVPVEMVDKFLEKFVQEGMPLGRDSAYKWLEKRYWGFKKRKVHDFISSLESVQLLKKRPHKNTRRNLTHVREGVSQVILSKKYGGSATVGIDLAQLPQQTENYPKKAWTKYKYLYVAVAFKTGYLWAYPMTSKTAVSARTVARKLAADFKKQYGVPIKTIVADAGSEFKGVHATFWKSKKVKLISAGDGQEHKVFENEGGKVWWVENKISALMRHIALLREGMGYGWQYALREAKEKVNNTYSRKIKMAPTDVTPALFAKKIKHTNLRLPLNPVARKQPVFEVEDRVRYLTKNARDVNAVLWKSYNAFRDPKTHVWSKRVFRVTAKRRRGRTHQYLVNRMWFFPFELQLVKGPVRKISKPVKQRTTVKSKRPFKDPTAEISKVNIRRGKRIRKQTQFYS